MSLTATQKRYLRGLCHDLRPIVAIGKHGITPAVLLELSTALDHHELVKVKLAGEVRKEQIGQIEHGTEAILVQSVGHVACFFRRNEKQPRLALPR